MNFEEELRSALNRKEPPPGFAERVLARAAGEPGRAPSGRPARWSMALRLYRVPAAIAASVLMLLGGVQYHRHQIRIEGEAAKEHLVLALRIAGSKLNAVQKKVVKEMTLPIKGEMQ